MKQDSLPSNYTAPKILKVGTNTLESVNVILSYNGFVPILIGYGKNPRIWLNIPANREGTEWYPLIKDNFSTNPRVIVNETQDSVKVTTPEGVIFEGSKTADNVISVTRLNLKPFGLDIESDSGLLKVMNQTFRASGFKNVGTMFAIGNA